MSEKSPSRKPLGTEEQEILVAFHKGRPDTLEREPEGSSVLSVRLPRATLKELTRLARQKDEPVGRVARELIETGLATVDGASTEIVFRAASRAAGAHVRGGSHNVGFVLQTWKSALVEVYDLDRELERLLHERVRDPESARARHRSLEQLR